MDPYAPFRPRATRVVCVALMVVSAVGSTAIVARLLMLGDYLAQIAQVVFVAVLALVFLSRMLMIRAIPDHSGLRIHNLIRRRQVTWPEVLGVNLGERPWVALDLSDGNVTAVMAIQRADGAYGQAQARRLAALVAAHEAGGEDSRGTGR